MSSGVRTRANGGKVLVYILLIIGVIISLFPFYVSLVHALQPDYYIESSGAPDLWPLEFRFENFAIAWEKGNFSRAMLNTVFIAAATTAVKTLGSCMAGYAFAKRDFKGKNVIFAILMLTIMIPDEVTMVPTYMLMLKLGWVNTYLPLIVPAVGDVFSIFLFKQFMESVPNSLIDAARIDGCNEWQLFWKIVLPTAKPAIATMAILGFQASYNDFMGPLIYLNDERLFTVQLQLKAFDRFYNSHFDQVLGSAANLIACVPVIVVFVVFQKYFVESVSLSGMKG